MPKLSIDQLKKLAAVEIMAEVNDNFDIVGVINKLVYRPNYPAPAATDGKAIIISDSLFDYPISQIYFILNHEFDHIYYRHHNRFIGKGFEHYVVNIATDLIINEILQNEGLDLPESGVSRNKVSTELGKRIVGKNSEDVYKEIVDAYKEKQQKQQEKNDQKNEDQDSQDDDSQDGESQSGNPQSDEKQKESKNKSSSSNMSEEEIEKALEDILGKELAEKYKEEIDAQEKSIQQAANEPLDEEEQQKIEEMKERILAKKAIASTKEKMELERGYVPPKVDWKSMLKRFLGRYLKRAEVRNYSRPTRRYDDILPSRVILPSMKGYVKTPMIHVYLDISGSMTDVIGNVRQVLEEAKRYFKQYKGKYYEFNHEIYEYSRDDFYRSTKVSGGTNITKVLNHYKQNSKADLGILVTDAEDEFSAALNSIDKPTLILTNNANLKTSNNKVTIVLTDFN